MAFCCPNCGSRFFKKLETRMPVAGPPAVLYKKRCKRCKHKHFLRLDERLGALTITTAEDWRAAPKLPPGCGVVVGEYTRRISGAAETAANYLHRVRKAEEVRHEIRPAVG